MEGHFALKNNSQYYYQVQQQMFVCGLSICDFVVWTEEGAYTVTLPYDEAFVDVMCRKIDDFWIGHVLPV